MFTVLELCAGGGGQALGLEQAGFMSAAAVEIESVYCETLRRNRPGWNVIPSDLRCFDPTPYRGVDLVAGGVPCPPFSVAGKQLGPLDERDLFPETLRIVAEADPNAVLIENVPGLGSAKFASYRKKLFAQLKKLGYVVDAALLNASDFGVPQLRPRYLIVALKRPYAGAFRWPTETGQRTTVGAALKDLMGAAGWRGASAWAKRADGIAPTITGGSKKHGGADLGPTRAKLQWSLLGVDATGVSDGPPPRDFPRDGNPKLTVRMAARVQGFPDDWQFAGTKTQAYRQVGNALPPPVATAVASAILAALMIGDVSTDEEDFAAAVPA